MDEHGTNTTNNNDANNNSDNTTISSSSNNPNSTTNNNTTISNATNNSNNNLDLGKFKSVEELQKSYNELEKKHYKELNKQHLLKQELEGLKNPKKSLTELITDQLSNLGFIDYEELVKQGYTGEVINIVKTNIETEKALATQRQQQTEMEVNNLLGAKKNDILSFGNEFFSSAMFNEQEQNSIELLGKNNPTLYAKITNLLYDSKQQVGSNTIVNPYTSPARTQDAFKSEAEYREAIRNPKFETDANFRANAISRARNLI